MPARVLVAVTVMRALWRLREVPSSSVRGVKLQPKVVVEPPSKAGLARAAWTVKLQGRATSSSENESSSPSRSSSGSSRPGGRGFGGEGEEKVLSACDNMHVRYILTPLLRVQTLPTTVLQTHWQDKGSHKGP